ncbi:lanthionine synthetase LanC family protein [Streptomyces sp. NPDC048002]|uniref:lanthionine synthetase LanC family protein n=1 Tax=Streptomyces sp. NPDC048002 TaxID=3154344 RepID=UPI0033C5684C
MISSNAVGTAVEEVEELAAEALRWLLAQAREVGEGGLGWPVRPSDPECDPMFYNGTAGIVPALLEAWRTGGDDTYADAAVRAARGLAVMAEETEDSSLYFGLTGMALALRAVRDELGDEAAGAAADRAMARVRSRFDGTRWGELFELMGGNAGIGLGALALGDTEFAVRAVEPYLGAAERTAAGVQWPYRPGIAGRMHHISHGTLGVVPALAVIGTAADRADLVELALAGAADVVARDEAGPEGFLVPHSDPPHRAELTARHNYGWCHGPSGDAQVFRLLRDALDDSAWSALADRCWHTVTLSGLPERTSPGFWDNNGRCCGTAGVLALACDRIAEQGDSPDFAGVLVADLAGRAIRGADGARWSNVEHRAVPSGLEPETGWAMGNAGIVRELLRFVRLSRGGAPDYAAGWPDQPPVRRGVPQATEPIRPAGAALVS